MRRFPQLPHRALCAALLACTPLLGCQRLIGLERRHLVEEDSDLAEDPDGGADAPDGGEPADADGPESGAAEDAGNGAEDAGISDRNAACDTYCDDVLAACTDGNDTFVSSANYASIDVCQAVCARLPLGDFSEKEPSDNSLACRKRNARLAKNLNAVERDAYCPAAGPGGGAPGAVPACGSNCEGYCNLYRAVCDPELDEAECVRQCGALPDTESINANADFAGFGDTVQCRLAHLSVAAFADPEAHCGHARLVPNQADKVSCDLGENDLPRCEDYCRLVNVACSQQDLAVYESEAQCLAVCGALPPGMARETEGNSVACRRWRGYAALLDPSVHCPNAGPAGPSPCGDPCEVYCDLLDTACAQDSAEPFDAAACKTACDALPFEGGYSVAQGEAGGATLSCRLLHVSRALAGDPEACEGARGAAPCQ